MNEHSHPSYPFPTIREVVCEIRFQLDASWDASLYRKYFKKIEKQFPTFEPVNVPVVIEISQSIGGGSSLSVPQVMRYTHSSRNLLIQLSENRIAVSMLPVYPGWRQMKSDIEYAWNKLCEVIQPSEITRVGLRYINAIERSTEDETLERWIKPGDYITLAALKSKKGFLAQATTRISESDRAQVTVTDQVPSDNYGTFIFDIDRITEQPISANIEPLLENANRLHDDVWNIFQSARNADLELLLKGEII